MIFFPPAKINLGLKVLFKRPDGYHELDTCMVPVPLHDILEILPAKEFSFHQTGLTFPGAETDNLCIRAYRLLEKDHALPPVYMHLRKIIPMGAGLGGGSSDAAWVLIGLNTLFDLGLSIKQLEDYAAQLGSDCPFFIANTSQIAGGRGEVLQPVEINLCGFYLKIVNPGLHVGTAEAYAGVHFSSVEPSIKTLVQGPMETWKESIQNDFERSVFERYPEISKIKEKLYAEGALFALMSGSGSTVYGIFRDAPEITFRNHPDYLEKICQFPTV
jgi:4-diphosphocytidyl-2-C-methyl-D-erythritol kinase